VAHRDEILAYADELLEVSKYREFAPAGAQVLGADEVRKVVCGVSSSTQLFHRAVTLDAQLVLVHHGLFWRNEPLLVDQRLKSRLQALFEADMTLAAYHLPLDAHRELGNAAQLAAALAIDVDAQFTDFGVGGRISASRDELVSRVRAATDREPLVFAYGPDRLHRVAVATGSGGYELLQAAREGYDAYVTGEAEEPNMHAAEELGITLIAAGHYATERLGVQALARHLAERFELEWEFVDLPNPV